MNKEIEQKFAEIRESNVFKRLDFIHDCDINYEGDGGFFRSTHIYFAGKLIGKLTARSSEMMLENLIRWFKVMNKGQLAKLMEIK